MVADLFDIAVAVALGFAVGAACLIVMQGLIAVVRRRIPPGDAAMRWGRALYVAAVLLVGAELASDEFSDFWTRHPMAGQVLVGALFLAATVLWIEELIRRRERRQERRQWSRVRSFALAEIEAAARDLRSALLYPVIEGRDAAGLPRDADYIINAAGPWQAREALSELLSANPAWGHNYWVAVPQGTLKTTPLSGGKSLIYPSSVEHDIPLPSAQAFDAVVSKWAPLALLDDDFAETLDEALVAGRRAFRVSSLLRWHASEDDTLDEFTAVLEALARVGAAGVESLPLDMAWRDERVEAARKRPTWSQPADWRFDSGNDPPKGGGPEEAVHPTTGD